MIYVDELGYQVTEPTTPTTTTTTTGESSSVINAERNADLRSNSPRAPAAESSKPVDAKTSKNDGKSRDNEKKKNSIVEQKKTAIEVLVHEPVGWVRSSFGHIGVRVNDKVYSFGQSGMNIIDFDNYMSNNSFRSTVGLEINLSGKEAQYVENYLANYKEQYTYIRNCTTPITSALSIAGHEIETHLLPVSLAETLVDSKFTKKMNFYPQSIERERAPYYVFENAFWAK